MSSTENPADPLSDLRTSLDEDEPFLPNAPATPPPAAAGGPPALPPPLPRRPSGKTAAFGAAGKSGGFPAAPARPSGVMQPVAPAAPVPMTPSGGSRAAGDPFKEPPEPRPPRSGSPEDKLEYFRTVLKLKEETLARGRQLYAERDAEVEKLRALASAMKTQLDDTLKQLEEARLELKANEDDRKDLSQALAETEAQVPALKEQLEGEKSARAAVTAELAGAKDALQNAQDRFSEVAAEKSEVEGNLEAVQEQYQVVSAENERLAPELEHLKEELAAVTAERSAAVAERDATKDDLEAANTRATELETHLSEAGANLKALEGESQWAKSSLEETQKRVTGAEQAKAQLEQRLAQHEADARAERDGLALQLEDEKARAMGLEGERNELAEELAGLKRDLETTKQQARTQLDAEKKKIHESLTSSFTRKLTDADGRLAAEQERTADLEARLAEAEGRAQALEEHTAQSDREHQEKLASVEGVAVKKLRDELTLANRKATEATVAGSKLQSQIAALEQAVARERAQAAAQQPSRASPAGGTASAEVVAERDKLKQDVANLKRKLVAAESAMEVAAALKGKVAKLEAELKKYKK
jgi:chromosome segregation ATPase